MSSSTNKKLGARIAIGLLIGSVVGLLINNLAVGVGLGLLFGVGSVAFSKSA